jgi:hypothetical protein
MTLPEVESKVEIICPHCNKPSSFLILQCPATSGTDLRQVDCAHRSRLWRVQLPGPVIDGPFTN